MKQYKPVLLTFGLLIVTASLYRAWDGRPFGFAPQIAMAIFGGAVVKDKRWAFILPLLSMFLSDCLYQALFVNGLSEIPGFYSGQWVNYLLFAGLTLFGFLMRKINAVNVLLFSLSGSLLFFITSNFLVWAGGGGLRRPKTFDGLMLCYYDAIAFYRDYGVIHGFVGNVFIGDLLFSVILFGAFYLLGKNVAAQRRQLA